MAKINGTAVKHLREREGLSRTQLAGQLGISVQYLCDIEAGRRNLARNPGLTNRIASELSVPRSMVIANEDVLA